MAQLSVSKISILSNSFAITQLPRKTYWQYDVVMTPEIKPPRKRQQLMHHLQTVVEPQLFNPRALYDGKAILYSSHELRLPGGQGGRFCVSLGKDKAVPLGTKGAVEIILSLTAGGIITPSSLERFVSGKEKLSPAAAATAINLLQIIVKQSPNQNLVQNARAFYVPEGKKQLEGGLELWMGFYQSVRPATGRMIINVDTSATVVYQGGHLIDLCLAFLSSGSRRPDIRDLRLRAGDPKFRSLQRHLQNLRIKVKTIKGTKVIRELREAVGRYVFTLDDGGETTVLEYYQRTHGIRLDHPDIIGVQTSGKNAPHPVLIPLELCEVVPGQFYKKTLSPRMTSEMVKFTAIRPEERLKRITGANDRDIQSPIRLYQQSEFIREAGMMIDRNPIQIDAKLLSAPRVVTRNNNAINPKNGAWDMRQKQVISNKTLKYWAAINFENSVKIDQFQRKFEELFRCSDDLGLAVENRRPTAWITGNPNNVEESLNDILRQTRDSLKLKAPLDPKEFMVFVILPDNGDLVWQRVKYWGDCLQGVMTQCFKASKFMSANIQFMSLVVLKLNARLGGQNAVIDTFSMKELSRSPYMLIGADVSHPGPGARKPSITSLVWSYDQHGLRYACRQRVQNPRIEIIFDLKDMMVEALKSFCLANRGFMPKSILFFRDGVSEGEYLQVEKLEIAAIYEAFDEVAQDPRAPPGIKKEWGIDKAYPKLLYVVVGKRHHNSFFPDPRDRSYQVDRTGNCPPGTLIDNAVIQPSIRDFFLQSHSGIKGTSRSGHYIILKDEIFGPANVSYLQQICYSLCHVYANCTRSISTPAPVYYADMACTTAASHFDPNNRALQYGFSDNVSTVSGCSDESFKLDEWEKAFIPVNSRLLNEMHFL